MLGVPDAVTCHVRGGTPILRLKRALAEWSWRNTIVRPKDVTALGGYRIWIRYSDGSAGEVDLADLAGRGVFSAWDDPDCFKDVHLGSFGAVAWREDIELCPDALYMELTGKTLDEIVSGTADLEAT